MWVHYSSVNKNAMYKKMKVFKRYLDAGLFPENYYNKIIHYLLEKILLKRDWKIIVAITFLLSFKHIV